MTATLSTRQLYPLDCDVQHYAWGDTQYIAALLGVENPDEKPFAELWMGAHPDLPSQVVIGANRIALQQFIAADPESVLGPQASDAFGQALPYLFKVLSAAKPLSIQVHPSKARAREGFAREEAEGVPVSAPHRNYKDENHKPELICALTDFYGLRGFRPLDEIAQVLNDTPELATLAAEYEPTPAGLARVYESFMTLPQDEVDAMLDPLIRRLEAAHATRPFTRDDHEYWVLRSDRAYSQDGHRDRGLLSVYLLNLVHLRPGEAMYQPAGVLHAYLEGTGMEIMANSNNVLRGGLTPKHVDVPELLSNILLDGAATETVQPEEVAQTHESVYRTPASEFELRRVTLDTGQTHCSAEQHSAEIIIIVVAEADVRVTATCGEQQLELSRGDVCLAPYDTRYTISATGPATLFKGAVPPVQAARS